MSFTAEYEDETATSATFNPTEGVSEYVIEGTFTGIVRLQMSIPDLDSFRDVVVVIAQGGGAVQESGGLNTPDLLMDYRFVASNIAGAVNVHFGP